MVPNDSSDQSPKSTIPKKPTTPTDDEIKSQMSAMLESGNDDSDFDDFWFWSDYCRSLKDGELPEHMGWPKDFPLRLGKVTQFAAQKHLWKARKGTFIPYMSHLLAVASLVYEMGGNPDEVLAALLHDVVEDTGTTINEVESLGGEHVAEIVATCSDSLTDKEKELPWATRKAKTLAKLTSAPLPALRVILADKLHNARSLVRDLKSLPNDQVWSRFSGKPLKIAVYYDSIVKHLLARKHEGDIVFESYVEELAGLVIFIKDAAARTRVP